MAHKQLHGVCYIDCTDSSHEQEEYGIFIDGELVRNGLRYFDNNRNQFEFKSSSMPKYVCSKDELIENKGILEGEDNFYEKKSDSKLKESFNIGDGLAIAFPLEDLKDDDFRNPDISDYYKSTNLLEAMKKDLKARDFKTKIDLAFEKFNTTLKLTDSKERITQNEILKEQNKAIHSQNALLQKNNNIQEKIANKETTFKNTANITNNFDKEFATTLGATIGNELKSVIEQQNQTLNTIKDLIQTQNKYYENKTTKSVQHNGKTYTPQEIEDLKNLQNLKGLEDENNTDLGEMLGLVEDFMDDGFTLDFNPFKFVLDELKKGLVEESEELKIKYNIKGDK